MIFEWLWMILNDFEWFWMIVNDRERSREWSWTMAWMIVSVNVQKGAVTKKRKRNRGMRKFFLRKRGNQNSKKRGKLAENNIKRNFRMRKRGKAEFPYAELRKTEIQKCGKRNFKKFNKKYFFAKKNSFRIFWDYVINYLIKFSKNKIIPNYY